jgi:hypothetical protein
MRPPTPTDRVPELLTLELLDRFNRTLRDVGAAIVDHWQPGLTREQMDAITEPTASASLTKVRCGGAGTTGRAHQS